ncbi:hypothetical protein BDZ89DRAFT_1129476 [Hymenopellis radicata]|nr:hypothetical protein BDZ89DRAFT_1129476 [Hymenopellis radicata]
MQTTRERFTGYSDFFASGFRAVVRRTSISLRAPTSPEDITTASLHSTPTACHRHPHSFSFSSKRSLIDISADEKQRRRASFMEFSSALFDKLTAAAADSDAPPLYGGRRRAQGLCKPHSDGWITGGGPVSYPFVEVDFTSFQTIDPFTSSPDAKSIFIDLSSETSTASSAQKRESFLSLSDGSVVSLVETPPPPRPMSLPAPTAVRKSPAPKRRDTINFPWVEDDEEDNWIGHTEDDTVEDPANRIDWRQFHVDVLLDD